MPFERKSIAVESYAGVTKQNMLSGEGSKRLVVLLPGLGYTVHAPLMHYLRNIIWSKGDDVLEVQYGFQIAQSDYSPEHQAAITQESQRAIEIALQNGYDELFMIGKSLGTPMAALFANLFPQTSKVILLTPIQNSHIMIEKAPTLAIIGTEDSRYDDSVTVDTELVTWKVYDGLNHSLEVAGNMIASLQVMPHIMQTCTNFLYHSSTP